MGVEVGLKDGRGVGAEDGGGVGAAVGEMGALVGGDKGLPVGRDTGLYTIFALTGAVGALVGLCVGKDRDGDTPAGSAASVYVA